MFSSIMKYVTQIGRFRIVNSPVQTLNYSQNSGVALRSRKAKSIRPTAKYFLDSKHIRVIGGKGGDGCISFLSLWCNENAGPDGGDGGNGGHVVFKATMEVNNLNHLNAIIKGDSGYKGANKDCHGKNANHNVIKVPVGTIIRDSRGKIVGDLETEGLMFIAARGGAGGKGNQFFKSDKEQAPQIAEFGAHGEEFSYVLELKSMANIGLIGLPNAGKSTLLQAISRARPKIASYPFTTLKPHLGIIQYSDYQQISVADLPGLIPGSHKNKGLGIQFLKHAERCTALLFVLDVSCTEPWRQYETLQFELNEFSPNMSKRPKLIIANKLDLLESKENLQTLKETVDCPVIPISAKFGSNLETLLREIRNIYDKSLVEE